MSFVAVGFCCMDIYEGLGRSYPTGNGVDVAMNLRKLGIPASVVSAVGDDPHGSRVRDVLAQAGVDVSHLRDEKGRTAAIRMRLEGANRVHGEEDEGVMANFHLLEEDIAFIQRHDLIHTDLFGRVYGLLPELKQRGARVAFDFSTFLEDKDVQRILPQVDYAFFSYGQRDARIEAFLRQAQAQGPRTVVAMLGEHGSLGYAGGAFHEEGIVQVQVVNTVGAGDAYIAGFLSGVAGGAGLPECMRRGARMAAQVISAFEPY